MEIIDSIISITNNCIKTCYVQAIIVSLAAGLIFVSMKGKQELKKAVGDFLFAFLTGGYLTLIAYGTFLLRDPGSRREVCLIPFHIFLFWDFEKVYIVGNILMMMPFGILIALRTKKMWAVALTSFFLSLTIEVTQYIFSVGKSEVDDLIFNTAGAVLAGLVCLAFRKKDV